MKVSKYYSFFLFTLFTSLASVAQVQIANKPYSLGTQAIESETHEYIIPINPNEFVSLAKTKGGKTGTSEFLLERYDDQLGTKWVANINVDEKEDISYWTLAGDKVVVFTTYFDTDDKKSTTFVNAYSLENGSKLYDKELDGLVVGEFTKNPNKAGVRESFNEIVNSSLTKNFVTPLQYRFQYEFSPNKQYLMVYSYDYSKANLFANVSIFDKNFNKIKSNTVPIDNGFINYGLFLNNKSEVFMLNSDHSGRVVVIKFNLENLNENITLDYQPANNIRDHLHMKILFDDVVYVANVNEIQGRLYGIMYLKFDFRTKLLENIVFHEFAGDMKDAMEAARKNNKSLKGEDTWYNYDLADFIVNESEHVTLILEKREIQSITYKYGELAINDLSKWAERSGFLNAESMILFSFDHEGTLKWENFHAKSQVIDLQDGLNTISYVLGDFDEKLRIVYATSDNTANFSKINFVEFDKATGYKNIESQLPNPENLSFLKKFSVWLSEDKFIMVGKKGLTGKSTFISKYKI